MATHADVALMRMRSKLQCKGSIGRKYFNSFANTINFQQNSVFDSFRFSGSFSKRNNCFLKKLKKKVNQSLCEIYEAYYLYNWKVLQRNSIIL